MTICDTSGSTVTPVESSRVRWTDHVTIYDPSGLQIVRWSPVGHVGQCKVLLIPDQFVGHRSLASYEKSQRYTMMILKIHHLQLGQSIRMDGLSVLDSKGLLTPLFVLNTTLSKDFILRGY